MLDNIKSDGFLFADDTKIFHEITSGDDAQILQSDIRKLEDWANKWLLKFHPDKCHVLTLGKFEDIMHTKRYTICGHELEHVFEENDLGVIFDSELSFDAHISTQVRKANTIVGLIRRSFAYLDCKSFKRLYTSFVRPHLEYAQCVWAPHLKKHTNMLENVQIRATKLVDGLSKLSYSDRLKRLDLPTLAYRRIRGDLIETFKHFNTYDQHVISSSFQPKERITRKHKYQLHERIPKDGTRGIQSNSFYFRVARQWNNLPEKVVDATNVELFKNRLDEFWQDNALKFDYKRLPESDS